MLKPEPLSNSLPPQPVEPNLQRLLRWEWLAGVALVPVFMLPGWSWLFGLVIIAGLCLGRLALTGRLRPLNPLDGPIGLVGLAAAIGLAASLEPNLSLNRLGSLLAGLVLYQTLTVSLTSAQVSRWGGIGLVGIGVLLGLASVVATNWGQGDLLKIPALYDRLPHLAVGSFGSGASGESEINPRVVGGVMAMLVPIGWCTVVGTTGRLRRWAGAGAGFCTLILLLTQSPSAIGGALVAGLLGGLGVWAGSHRWRWVAVGLGGLVGLTGLVAGGYWLLGQLPPPDGEPTQRIIFRLEMWLRSLDMLADKPFTGIGLNNFPQSLNQFYPTYSLGPEAHAHNLWLQTGLDGGLVGLIGLVAVLVGLVRLYRRAWRNPQADRAGRFLALGIGLGTLAWLFYGLIESITLAHKPAIILWLMWGLLAVLAQSQPAQKSAGRVRWATVIGLTTGLSLVVGGLALGGWQKLELNLAILEGQRIITANHSEAGAAAQQLDEVGSVQSWSAATLELRARLALRETDYPTARRFLIQSVGLDAQHTIDHYIPAQWSIWRKAQPAPPQPLLRLYNQWVVRYPTDPLASARLGIAQQLQGNPQAAQATFAEGFKRTHEPFLQFLEAEVAGSKV